MSTTVILAAGLFPTTPRALAFLHNADYIACCDGAANACVDAGFEPDVIVGDGHVLKQGRRDRFVILGATGKREDHALANLALLLDYAQEHPDVLMISDFGTFYPARDLFRASVPQGSEVSIFNFGATAFSATGLQYPLYDFTRLWQGTLNVALRPDIEIRAEGAFLVYVAEPDR